MKAGRNAHPLIRKIARAKRQKKISDKQIADYLCISQRTLYRRYEKPGDFSEDEVEDLAKLFGWAAYSIKQYVEV